jgi:isoaspartyl peptidase/L-asparaginase-like protein (Ntn-hydrolase superfamily)
MVVRERRKTMGIGSGGIILIDRRGKIEYAHNATYMPVCYVTVKSDPITAG